ncbi:hypothetical protein evm_014078, partial [Chilo suppressalis]
IEGSDEQWDVSGLFGENAARNVGALAAAADDPEPRRDQEDYYLAIEGSDEQWDVSGLFGENAARNVGALAAAADDPEPRRDQEDYYLAKFRAYVSCAGRLARVEARAAAARARLGDGAGAGADTSPPPPPPSPPRRAAARARRDRFAAPLDDRLPLVLTSCVRVIATYGLKHQGIFRVSGSQVEMQSLRAAFERGEDPLAGARDASDVNRVSYPKVKTGP